MRLPVATALLVILATGPSPAVAAQGRDRAERDGGRFCRQQLRQSAVRGRGKWRPRPARACVVLDLDSTLADKRPLVVAAAHEYGKRHGQPRLAALTERQVGWTGRETARNAGLAPREVEAFQRFWERYFYAPENFTRLDRPIAPVVELARDAARAGCEVFYLTARFPRHRAATVAQLERFGLPNADAKHVICQPPRAQTVPFKVKKVRRLRARRRVLWFVSDSLAEVKAVKQRTGVPSVLVDFPVKAPGEGRAFGIPRVRVD